VKLHNKTVFYRTCLNFSCYFYHWVIDWHSGYDSGRSSACVDLRCRKISHECETKVWSWILCLDSCSCVSQNILKNLYKYRHVLLVKGWRTWLVKATKRLEKMKATWNQTLLVSCTKGTKLYIFIFCTVLFPFLTIFYEKIFLFKACTNL
jgi:hypothetical protein